jgi:uncharacterized damage-inducible protein DinB
MAKESMLILRDAVRLMMLRDLRALDREIAAFPDDESLWLTPNGISNSAGNLALHMSGNLRHFIGAVLGNNGYVRDRDAEFMQTGLSRFDIRQEVGAAIGDIEAAFDAIGPAQLESPYPLLIRERRINTADFLVHLAVHLAYHLGQVDYHRRLLTSEPQSVDAMSLLDLPVVPEGGTLR